MKKFKGLCARRKVGFFVCEKVDKTSKKVYNTRKEV